MKVSNKINSFINKSLKYLYVEHKDSDHLTNNKSTNEKDDFESKVNNKIDYKKDNQRILGGTDYKKYEEMSKEIDKIEISKEEEKKSDQDKLKMGCNNDLSKERQLYDKSTTEKIEAAKLFKTEGDYFLKEKNYDKAEECYEKALLQLFYTFEEGEEDTKTVDDLKYSLNMNIAMCKMSKEKYKESIGYLNEALKINASSVKSYYRLSYIYFKLEDFNTAKEYSDKGKLYSKNNSDSENFDKLLLEINEKEEKLSKKSEMFMKKLAGKIK